MTARQDILSRFRGDGNETVLYLPDLTMWHAWHQERGSLPPDWQGRSSQHIARELGSPTWWAARPWRMDLVGVEVLTEDRPAEKLIRYQTEAGTLSEKWTLGPDGDWWRTEYPIKTAADIPAARMMVAARSYAIDAADWEQQQSALGENGVLAIEIPQSPYSDLLHTILGWGEGLMLMLGDQRTSILDILEIMESQVQDLARKIATLPGEIVLAPDNLDGQFISPPVFRDHLAQNYRRTADVLHQQDKYLLVHAGGPIKRLLEPLSAAGVDGVQGVAPPPQSDASLTEARQAAGPDLTLWGGIPQDFVLAERSQAEFEAAVRDAVGQARGDARTILGVADKVPVLAELDRLKSLPRIVAES